MPVMKTTFSRKRRAAVAAAVIAAAAAAGLAASSQANAATTPAKPAGIKVSAVTSSSLTVTWTQLPAGETAEVQVYDASTGAGYVHDKGKTGTSDTVGGLPAGTALDVRMVADRGSVGSGWTTPVLAFTAASGGGTGTQGPAGPAGPQGPSGVVSSAVKDLGGVGSVPTGGSFVSKATQVGTVTLDAGTYLITLNAKATPPAGGTGAVEVFPEFFVYDQAANASFTGDLLNAGAGALESGAHATIDSYYSGAGQVTLTESTTLHVYAFGYDSDTGAGTYALDDLTVTATKLQVGS
jgi:hypothetical protein